MEPQGSQEPSPAAPVSDESTPQPQPEQAPTERPQSAAAQWLLFAGIAVAVVSLVIALGVLRDEEAPPAETPPPVAVTPPPAPDVESTPPPAWTGSRHISRADDGSKSIVFTLAAGRDLPVWMSHARPALVVRCLYRRTDVFVALDTSTSYEDDADRRTVTIQWDDDPASTQRWGLSESGKELFAPDGMALVRRLAAARSLRFGFSPFNASPVTAEFLVEGFGDRAGLVARACGWRLDDQLARTE